MKLYTKEQVIEMIYDAHNGIVGYDDIFKKQTPIELPSSQDIEKESNEWWGPLSFREGAKWVIEQIKQQGNGSNTK